MRIILAAALAIVPLVAKDPEPAKRLTEAAAVFSEIMAIPDKAIPEELLANAHCIVIVPSLKTGAFVIGGKYGKGYVSCRNKSGPGWSAPGTVRIEGGSVGFQIGGSTTDLIMLVMNERGADKLLASKFTLGAEGSVAAGPVGRTATAQTDAQMHAEILSWSRSQGLFAGLALEGATLRQDLDDNATLYGKQLENRQIVTTRVRVPKAAAKLIALLNKYSAREQTSLSKSSGKSAAERGKQEEQQMNWDQIEGKWKQFTGSARERWGKLTDDDWDKVAGKREHLIGQVQERYGIAKDEAEKQADEWSRALKETAGTRN